MASFWICREVKRQNDILSFDFLCSHYISCDVCSVLLSDKVVWSSSQHFVTIVLGKCCLASYKMSCVFFFFLFLGKSINVLLASNLEVFLNII